eukprot:4803816-Prymnesium_polylepis.1
MLSCTTPVATTAADSQVYLVYGASNGDTTNHPAVVSTFTFYDAYAFKFDSIFPIGSAYNLPATVWMTGYFPVVGPIVCLSEATSLRGTIGGNITMIGAIVNTTSAYCPKPVLPNDAKHSQELEVRIAPINRCEVNATFNFSSYNAQISSLSISGAPSTTPVSLTITGAGFPYPMPPGSTCRFSNSSYLFKSAATVLSTTQLSCPTPGSAFPGSYNVEVALNDLDTEPTLYGTPTFAAYDKSLVSITSLTPSAVPLLTNTTLTVQGTGFAEYGSSTSTQLVCQVGTGSAAQIISARFLDSSTLQCQLPPVDSQ